MSEATKKVTVTLVNTFPAASRVRAGIRFEKGETKTLELTKDQVEAFKDDQYFTIGKGKSADKSGNAGESESSVGSASTETEADTTSEDESSASEPTSDEEEDQGSSEDASNEEPVDETPSDESAVDDAENASDEEADPLAGTDDEVLQANSRDELEALAVKAGVENPASFKDKPKLLAAIREKQAVQE